MSDVFIAGYPGSGKTWFHYFVTGLVHAVPPDRASEALIEMLVPDAGADPQDSRDAPGFYRTDELPRAEHDNVVVLVRDGRDVAVEQGEDVFCRWHAHVNAWLAAKRDERHPRRVLFIRYEDLVSNPVHELLRFCDFVGLERTLHEIEAVADAASCLRLGHPGAFRTEMSPHALAAFEREAGETLRRCGYPLEAGGALVSKCA